MGLFDKLKRKLNGDNDTPKNKQKTTQNISQAQEDIEDIEKTQILEETQIGETEVLKIKTKEKKVPKETYKNDEKVREKADNTDELEELTMVRIKQLLKNFQFSAVKIQKVRFHLKNPRTDVYSVRAENKFKSDGFLDDLKAQLENDNVQYAQDLSVEIVFKSPKFNDFTKITQQVSVEILTPPEIFKQQNARITASSGKMYKDEYILTPERTKPYLIGREQNPKLASGRIIRNDIGFIPPKEGDSEDIQLNKYVSRSILLITYNKERNKYEIGRTNFMFDSNHIVKINRMTNRGTEQEIRLNTPHIRVPLEDGDMIIINREVNILFELIEEDEISKQ